MTDLTENDKQVLLNIIGNTPFIPDQWETVIKPIVIKLKGLEAGVKL